jgi:hypothetical protein
LRLGLRELPVGLRKLALRLVDRGLKRARIDLEKHLAFLTKEPST